MQATVLMMFKVQDRVQVRPVPCGFEGSGFLCKKFVRQHLTSCYLYISHSSSNRFIALCIFSSRLINLDLEVLRFLHKDLKTFKIKVLFGYGENGNSILKQDMQL